MDTIAILCPGPSLARLAPAQLGTPRAIIAVNTAMIDAVPFPVWGMP